MKIRNIVSVIISLLTTILPPILINSYVGGNDAWGVLFILIFTLYPLVSIVIGILSGIKKLQWYIPIINSVIFLTVYIIFTGFDPTLLIAAIIYAILGIFAAYITKLISSKKQKSE